MLEDFDGINEKFKEFGKMGIKVTIDDFGTGYSCFSRIENIYMDCVKVDKYFIDKILHQDQEKTAAPRLDFHVPSSGQKSGGRRGGTGSAAEVSGGAQLRFCPGEFVQQTAACRNSD